MRTTALSTIARHFIVTNRYWILLGISLSVLFYVMPLTGDDFMFASFSRTLRETDQSLIDGSTYMYNNVNGRILGNGLSLALMEHRVLGAMIMSAFVVVLFSVMARIAYLRRGLLRNFLVIAALLLPVAIFNQTYSWRSGFYNYIPSALAILIALLYMRDSFIQRSLPRPTGTHLLALTLLGFIGSLFVENATIALIGIAVVAMFASYKKWRRIGWQYACFAVGTFLGAVVMFGAPGYHTANVRNSALSNLSTGVFVQLQQYMTNIAHVTQQLSVWLLIPLCVLGIVAAVVISQRIRELNTQPSLWPVFAIATLLGGPIVAMMLSSHEMVGYTRGFVAINTISALVLCLFVIVSAVVLWKYLTDEKVRMTTLILLGTILLYVAPFVVVKPFGGRNAYFAYIALIVIVCAIVNYLLLHMQRVVPVALQRASYLLLGIVVLLLYGVFGANHFVELQNAKVLHRAVNTKSSVVWLKRYPFELYELSTPRSRPL